VCGNGTVEAYEECDDGATTGATGDKCSTTCRCTTQYIATSPVGPSGGSTGCQ
jgi:cysteine-rich repeat protein